jgi:hypothetical protein
MTTAPQPSVKARLAALGDEDPDVRSEAASALGERWKSGSDGLPPTPELMAALARRDAVNPGIADAFWTTIVHDFMSSDDFGWSDAKRWMLGVLRERRDRQLPLSPVPGNDLEFYAHEVFDDDVETLTALLAWGYTDVVEWALDHRGALTRDHTITLLTALHEKGCPGWGNELAVSFGILRDDVVPLWQAVTLRGVSMRMLTVDYGYNRLWTVHFLFPHPSPWTFPFDGPESLLESVIEAGVPVAEEDADLDVSRTQHITFPDVQGTTRRSYHPRRDLALDVATIDENGTVAAIRVVQARAPKSPHAIELQRRDLAEPGPGGA